MFKIKLMSVPLIVAIVVSTFLAGLQVLPVYAAVIYVSGHITTNTTWTAGNVYVIENPVTVDSGVVLTVEAGVIVKFAANKLASSEWRVKSTRHIQQSRDHHLTQRRHGGW